MHDDPGCESIVGHHEGQLQLCFQGYESERAVYAAWYLSGDAAGLASRCSDAGSDAAGIPVEVDAYSGGDPREVPGNSLCRRDAGYDFRHDAGERDAVYPGAAAGA